VVWFCGAKNFAENRGAPLLPRPSRNQGVVGAGMALQRPFPLLTGGPRSCRSHSNPLEKIYVKFYGATMRAYRTYRFCSPHVSFLGQ
jgi:hypothetical protein